MRSVDGQRHALDRCVEECTRNGCYALRHNDVFLFPVISDKHAVAQRDEAGVIIYQMITESCVQERIRTDVLAREDGISIFSKFVQLAKAYAPMDFVRLRG